MKLAVRAPYPNSLPGNVVLIMLPVPALQAEKDQMRQKRPDLPSLHHRKDRMPTTLPTHESEAPSETTTGTDLVLSPKASLMTGDGQECPAVIRVAQPWIYRMASDVRRNLQSQTTPISTPTPRIDDAMLSLSDALDDLGRLRIRTDARKVDLNLSPKEVRASVDAFVHLMSNMVVPDVFAAAIDVDLLRVLPDIIKSAYVKVDPGVYVMYYNALYYGLHQIRGAGDVVAQSMYLKVLEAVPAWLDASVDTDLDGYTAALTAWTAISNNDYQLSWKFHCKSCHYIKARKIDQLDVIPAKTFEEEDKRDTLRYLYWHILSTDTLYRLIYGKPTVVRWAPHKVRPPAILRTEDMHPSVSRVTVSVVWIRYTLMTAEMLNEIDNDLSHERDGGIQHQVDDFCIQLENLMAEWKMESIMRDNDMPQTLRYLIADHVMNIYAIIIGIKRLVKPTPDSDPVDAIALRAARKVAQITLEFAINPAPADAAQSVYIYFISFYPFCAVFSLYEHILACANPEDCEQDIRLLESVGAAMAEASTLRTDLVPFARTINALNKVSRTIQDERRKAGYRDVATGETANNMPEFDFSAFASFSGVPYNVEDSSQPLSFVRALENDFTTRNWHEGWWDVGADLDDPMMGLPEDVRTIENLSLNHTAASPEAGDILDRTGR
ncbi:Uncharacterized protein BP5553_00531 [Venustampulla echinocandica]|uniref:Transcription factor domain-containing protein n=1 Tax=Venustampulla echinocandica TaxID=2656787 RepID=A0A370TYF9_9HELO|nr:Uncharacterized protein BP5553_00531 [Venustampulla echinocandica]RDL40552.1 Uncharacterized protein BP5553_00531 [Venustampulla echinocandica]